VVNLSPVPDGNNFNRDYHVLFTKEELATGKGNHNCNLEAFPRADPPGFSVLYKTRTERSSTPTLLTHTAPRRR